MNPGDLRERLRSGARATISLFMVIILTPFLTTAALLIEVQRYNSAVSILDEAMGVSSISVLANYDPYLLQRWGLTAVSQEEDIDAQFASLLDVNAGIMGNTISLKNTSASGVSDSALSKISVFKNNVNEYSKLNVPTKLMTEYLALNDLISSLEKIGDMSVIMNVVSSGISTVDSMIECVDACEKVEEVSRKIEGKEGEYESCYSSFEFDANALVDACNELDRLDSERNARKAELTAANSELIQLTEQKSRLETQLAELEKNLKEDYALGKITYEGSLDELLENNDERKGLLKDIQELRDQIEQQDKGTKQAQSDYESAEAEYNAQKNAIQQYEESFVSSRNSYASLLGEIAELLTNFKSKMGACFNTVKAFETDAITLVSNAGTAAAAYDTKKRNDVEQRMVEVRDQYNDFSANNTEGDHSLAMDILQTQYLEDEKTLLSLNDTVVSDKYDASVIKATGDGAKSFCEDFYEANKDYSDDFCQSRIDEFKSLKTKVESLEVSTLENTRVKVTRDEYKSVELDGFVPSSVINGFLEDQKSKLTEEGSGGLLDFLKAARTVIQSLFKMQGILTPADISMNAEVSGLKGEVGFNVDGLSANLSSLGDDLDGFVNDIPGLSFLGTLQQIRSFLAILEAVLSTVENILSRLINFSSVWSSFSEGYILQAGYAAFNLSCRTDFLAGGNSFSPMTGFSLSGADLPAAFSNSSEMFCAGELEYLVRGSGDEISNQTSVYWSLFALRCLLNIGPVASDHLIQTATSSAGPYAPLVLLLIILAESLIDVVLLVNGCEVAFYKFPGKDAYGSGIYLSPGGIVKLVTQLVTFIELTDEQRENISNGVLDAYNITDVDERQYYVADAGRSVSKKNTVGQKVGKVFSDYPKSLLNFNYRDYLFFYILLLMDPDLMLERLSNIVELETRYYYKKNGKDYVFDLDASYTMIESSANVSIKQFLPSITDSSLFNIERTQYRGY